MIDFLSVLFSPMTILFFLITGCLVQELAFINSIQRGSRRRKPRWLLLGTIIWFFTITTEPVPRLLAGTLENRYEVFDTSGYIACDTTLFIAVLGEGSCGDMSLPATGKLSPTSLGRLSEAVRIHNMIAGSIIVTFGQHASDTADENGIFTLAAIEMGVNPGKITQIGNTINTWSEASEFTARFGHKARVIIVTDAMQMTRAMKFFREFGLKSEAAPANFTSRLVSTDTFYRWLPSTRNINIMTLATQEISGLIFYNILLSGNLHHKSWKKVRKSSTLTN